MPNDTVTLPRAAAYTLWALAYNPKALDAMDQHNDREAYLDEVAQAMMAAWNALHPDDAAAWAALHPDDAGG